MCDFENGATLMIGTSFRDNYDQVWPQALLHGSQYFLPHNVDLLVGVDGAGDALGLVVLQDRHGFAVVGRQAADEGFSSVVTVFVFCVCMVSV